MALPGKALSIIVPIIPDSRKRQLDALQRPTKCYTFLKGVTFSGSLSRPLYHPTIA